MLLCLRMVGLVLAVVILFGAPVHGASPPQTADDVVILQAQSTITLTLTMKDGEIYQVPMVLDIETVQGQDTATIEITDVTVDHRNNYLVEVENIGPVTATVQFAGEGALTETTPITTLTAGPIQVTATGRGRLNVRSGPGTDYAVVGQVAAGDELLVVGQNADGSWLVLEDGGWIAAFLVDGDTSSAPLVQSTPTPTPVPTVTPIPVATESSPASTVQPSAAPAEPMIAVGTEGGIELGEPVVFDTGGFATVGVLVRNTTNLVKSFSVQATYKSGDQILAVAWGAVNDLLPGQTRAALLLTQDTIPTSFDSVRVNVDTMVRESRTTDGAEVARKLTFGPVVVRNDAGLATARVEVTNHDSAPHTFSVQTTFTQGGKLVALGSGAVNNLGPGQTKTAMLLIQGNPAGAEIQTAVETVVE